MAKFEEIKERVIETRTYLRENGDPMLEMTRIAKDREELAHAVNSLLKMANEFENTPPLANTKYAEGFHSGLRTAATAVREIIEGELK